MEREYKLINKNIQISRPKIDKEEISLVKKVLSSGWLTQGKMVAKFEKDFSKLHNVKYSIAVSSCTTGLHLMLEAAGITKGDEVIVPSFTWISTVNSILYVGAKPVFVDVSLDNFNIDIDKIRKKINKKTKAIIIVHLFGLCVDIYKLKKNIPDKIIIFEDCACAVGSKINNNYAGSFGLAGSFSFHPRKIITTGEGGMVTTNNKKFADKVIELRNHGASIPEEIRHKSKQPFFLPSFNVLGFNYRMTDLQGAVGVAQIKKLNKIISFRQKWASFYNKNLKDISWITLPKIPKNYFHSYQSFVFIVNKQSNKNRDIILSILFKNGISCRPGTHAVHTLNFYKKNKEINKKNLLNSEFCQNNTIALPLHNNMKPNDFKYIISKIKKL